ncbi:MAG: alkaline phosphatase D family protein [Flavobacteriia bacterium]|nr:alkaline phosphatase D family protein [Flavobacteriia bacterium]
MKSILFLFAISYFATIYSQTSVSPVECIAPFYHGVASGDPLSDRVIIWTRITPQDFGQTLVGNYHMATDDQFQNIVATGTYTTDSTVDFTVKIDVIGLQPNTFYYYEFEYNGAYSLVGRTKTLPIGDVENMRLACVSCANLESGYFNVYDAIANRNDVDAVLMLGDYIYEYETGGFGPNGNIDRIWDPAVEIVDLNEYRLRYSSYRMDYALRKLHQNFPWICIWDDHETANDAYKDGAENHQVNEGPWNVRKDNGKRAYFEWIPIRPKAPGNQQIYRTFELGNLAKIIMLDTRLEGREVQLNANDANFSDTSRTLLGNTQMTWLKNELSSTTQPWKILGNQVMVGAVNLLGSPVNTDSWDGYPAERQRLFNHLSSQNIDNTVVVTGDIHTSWALNLQNGNTPVGVEFVSPSVTSPGAPINLSALITAQNPHIKYVELTKKGFVLVDIDANRVQGDWYNISTLDQMDPTNSCVKSYITNNGSNSLTLANSPSIGHGPFLQSLADPCSRFAGINSPDLGIIVGVYPNPANQLIKIQSYDLSIESVTVYGSNGEIIKTPYSINPWSNGMTITSIDISTLKAGNYFLRINNENQKTCGLKSIPFVKN